MKRRVVGIETEYGLTAPTVDGTPSTLDADAAARELFTPLLHRGRSSNVFLRNGGRLYLDVGAHPEYATAECDTLSDLLAQDRAGRHMLADLAHQANERLASEGKGERLHLIRNNVDSQGNSYGCHENYLLHRRRDFRQVADALIAYFITRQALVGAGHIRHTPSGPSYGLSQRADQMWDAVSSATTRSRPIINTRDEPLADSTSYRRMHVIVGDSNICEATTALKVGATEMLLDAVEDGLHIEDLALADPMRSIRELNTDLSGTHRLDLADGRQMSAADIQREIRRRVLHALDVDTLSPLHRYVADLWGRGIDALASGVWNTVETELDFAIKYKLLTSYCRRANTTFADPRVARLDLSYHDITNGGLAPRMEASGLMRRLTTDAQVLRALTVPPATTRAHLRGMVIGAAEDARVDLAADWVHLRLEIGSATPLALQDPLASHDPRIDAILDLIHSQSPVLPA
ncbi:Pup--protein ligase [Schaalia suimastitidis]|uniref:Pup--protein ligase n=1 Tax=Schaalia suimastitidis TaxID=121163 RepID=UPI00040935F6|nr:Pup--protein ligase [Schaalia suimastitidis]